MNIGFAIRNFSALLIILLVSCGEDAEFSDVLHLDTTKNGSHPDDERITNIMHNVPSAFETVSIIEKTGASYTDKLPNDPLRINDYLTISQKALNIGVYGADLNYASVFDETADIMLYLKATRYLGEDLGIMDIITEDVLDRVNDNFDQKDSLQSIFSEIYSDIDTYFKDDGRHELSVLIVIGSWIEAAYLATQQLAINPDSEQIAQRVAEQKYSLNSLIALAEGYSDKDVLDHMLLDLKDLNTHFNSITEVKKDKKGNQDNNTKTNDRETIGHEFTLIADNKVMNNITSKVNEIRSGIVSF